MPSEKPPPSRPPSRKDKARAHYPQKDAKKTGFIIAVGAFIMIAGHFAFWEVEDTLKKDEFAQNIKVQSEQVIDEFQEEIEEYYAPQTSMEELRPAKSIISGAPEIKVNDTERLLEEVTKVWDTWSLRSENNDKNTSFEGQKKIVIIIDDMGVSPRLSNQVIDLPAPLTLAFLPYASGLPAMTERAKERGHELMIHMPMEPMNGDLDVGSIAIKEAMSEDIIAQNLEKAFDAFEGEVGMNNHMGSRVTQNQTIMNQVMKSLLNKDLFFVDSITIQSSVAGQTAADFGLKYAERDVFLDHEETDMFVQNSLKRLEDIAEQRGYAIAIGHPKAVTIRNLKAWIPTLKERGFEIIPVSRVVQRDAPTASKSSASTPSSNTQLPSPPLLPAP